MYIKYVKQSGGSQDNQIRDAANFVVNANKYVRNNNDNLFFTVVLDGEYGNSKADCLRSLSVHDRVRVTTTDEYTPPED